MPRLKGFKHPKEVKLKISKALQGIKRSKETKRKMSLGKMGDKNPMKRMEVRKKVSDSLKGRESWNKGIPMSEEQKIKLSKERMGKTFNTGRTHFKKGNIPHNYMGGISFEPYGKEFNNKLKEKIRKRDSNICKECGYSQESLGYKLSVHHIDYNKKNSDENNLISLCRNCHVQTNFNRDDWTNYFKGKLT